MSSSNNLTDRTWKAVAYCRPSLPGILKNTNRKNSTEGLVAKNGRREESQGWGPCPSCKRTGCYARNCRAKKPVKSSRCSLLSPSERSDSSNLANDAENTGVSNRFERHLGKKGAPRPGDGKRTGDRRDANNPRSMSIYLEHPPVRDDFLSRKSPIKAIQNIPAWPTSSPSSPSTSQTLAVSLGYKV